MQGRRSVGSRRAPTTPGALLRQYVGAQRTSVVVMTVLLLVSIGLEIAEPQIVALFIESIQLGRSQSALVDMALIFLGVAAARQISKVIAAYASERVSWSATNAAREDLALHVLHLDLTFHERRSAGELIERIDGDVNQIAEFFSSLIVQLVGNAVLMLGILVALASIDWRIGLTFAGLILLGYVLMARVATTASAKWEDDRECSAQFFGNVSELVRATEDLRSSAATDYGMSRFYRHLRAWLPVKVRVEGWSSGIWVVLSLVFTLGSAFAFEYGGVFYASGAVSLAGVYLIVAYATMLNEPMEMLRQQVQGLQLSLAAIRRIAEVFRHRSNLVDGSLRLPPGPLSVEFDRVSFEYRPDGTFPAEGDRRDDCVKALHDLSFHVQPGAKLGLVGRTGAGKTTIAHLMFRMYDPGRGRVLIGGVNTRMAALASLHARVGFVTQDVHIFDATLRENLTLFDSTISDERLLDILDLLEMRAWLDELPDGLSSQVSEVGLSAGQAQLLALVRVFLKDPGLVVLDEPSSKLDLATEAIVERALDRLLDGRTVIVIAHRLDTILRTDEVLVLDDGSVVESGPTADLLGDHRSRLAELCVLGRVHQ